MNTILNDKEISELALKYGMISPFEGKQVRKLVSENNGEMIETPGVSFGLSSFGYDLRCSDQFKIFTNVNTTVVDPKNFDERSFVEVQADRCIIPPNSFVLTRTVEYFKMPRNVVGIVLGKSTYARCGISCLATPLEPGWEGHLVLEFANTTPLPAILYANEGCAQVMFFEGNDPNISYADRGGKYQGQTGVTTARM